MDTYPIFNFNPSIRVTSIRKDNIRLSFRGVTLVLSFSTGKVHSPLFPDSWPTVAEAVDFIGEFLDLHPEE